MPCPLDAHLPYSRRFRRLPSGRAPASQPSCRHLFRASNARRRFDSNCSALRHGTHAATMASADFCCPIATLHNAASTRQDRRSLRVRRVTFLPYTRRIYVGPVRMTSGFESLCPLAHQADASYAVRVPRAGSLPTASFRFHLTVDTLAVRLGVPVIKASTGTSTRQVTSRFALATRSAASGHDAARHA
jgi:hypothetical protein